MRNGIVDEDTGTCPDIHVMLATIPGHLSDKDHELLCKNFKELYQIQKERGHISDIDFERLQFPKDTYSYGTEFERLSEYAPRMRAFDMSHKCYLGHLKKVETDLRDDLYKKKMYDRAKDIINKTKECENEILNEMVKNGINSPTLVNAELKHFASNKCTASRLKKFHQIKSMGAKIL